MKIYVSSKFKHRDLWLSMVNYWNIISTWIHLDDVNDSSELGPMWERYFDELKECDRVVVYVAADDVLKGALIEVGAALAENKPVVVVSMQTKEQLEKQIGTWIYHPMVSVVTEYNPYANS